MFERIYGRYLVDTSKITEAQFDEAFESTKSARARLGTIAVAEQMLTQEQADELNELQAATDKRFGTLAVEKNYLTDEQVDRLLKKQGNKFLVFIQALIDGGVLTLDENEDCLEDYREANGFTHSDMDDLVSGDVDREINVYLPSQKTISNSLCSIAMRTTIRLIDNNAYVKKAYITNEISADKGTLQKVCGDHTVHTFLIGNSNSLLGVAETYAKEEFGEVDLDALDAVAEFSNVIDGLLATELSKESIDIDMEPPVFYPEGVKISGKDICVFPIIVLDEEINLVVTVDSDIEIK